MKDSKDTAEKDSEKKPALNEPDPDNDDVKEEKEEDGGGSISAGDEDGDVDGRPDEEEEEVDEIKIVRKNRFKKSITIANVCEPLPIKPFVPKSPKRKDILPIDVPLVFGLDSGTDGKLDTSIMIRKIVQHYVTVNNRVLTECHQLGGLDGKEMTDRRRTLGLEPALDSAFVSRANDVVDIGEEELRDMIQQCYQQQLRYGADHTDAVNWRLLESRLKERYITGRKFVFENPIQFEFAGQFNIPMLLSKIDRQHALVLQADPTKEKYFEKASPNLLSVLKLNIRQCAVLNQNDIGDDYQNVEDAADGGAQEQRRMQKQKKRMMAAYRDAKNAVEQTLVALQRQKHLPEQGFVLETYMKDNLHLYAKEYAPFIRTQLHLKHLEGVWRFLDKSLLLTEGTWHEIPQTTMEMYKNPINDQLKTEIMQFMTTMQEMDTLWTFLSAFRRFLGDICKRSLSKEPDNEYLKKMLYDISEDVDPELVDAFPDVIKLSQAGYAYQHAAKEYQKRSDREAQGNV